MSDVENLTVEILKSIRSDLRSGLESVRAEVAKTNDLLDNLVEMQDLLAAEHRKTNQRPDFFAEELVRMRTRDMERITALEGAVAELQRKVG